MCIQKLEVAPAVEGKGQRVRACQHDPSVGRWSVVRPMQGVAGTLCIMVAPLAQSTGRSSLALVMIDDQLTGTLSGSSKHFAPAFAVNRGRIRSPLRPYLWSQVDNLGHSRGRQLVFVLPPLPFPFHAFSRSRRWNSTQNPSRFRLSHCTQCLLRLKCREPPASPNRCLR